MSKMMTLTAEVSKVQITKGKCQVVLELAQHELPRAGEVGEWAGCECVVRLEPTQMELFDEAGFENEAEAMPAYKLSDWKGGDDE